MFYDAVENKHGLKHDPYKAIVAPRPIGWISSLDVDGVPNLAPYSFFNGVADRPHVVMFSSAGRKDSIQNIEQTKEFVCNLATWDLRNQMNMSSATVPPGVNEFQLAGLTEAACNMVSAPRVGESPVAMECKYLQTIDVKDLKGEQTGNQMVLGQVVGIHIDETFIEDGILNLEKVKPIARLGYMDYTVVDRLFTLLRPDVVDGKVVG
ncbi:MAG: flavin reductase family protein [Fimbriimonadaceae bacterium]|nr:flavin reductase family protein [Alphaproteobacteria bacterium]